MTDIAQAGAVGPEDETPARPEQVAQGPDLAPHEDSAQEEEIVSSPALIAIPEVFQRLKDHCDQQRLKSNIVTEEPFAHVAIDFKNGRNVRTLYIGDEEDAEALLTIPIGEIIFLGGYAAICSYTERWIEAAVRRHGVGPITRPGLRSLLGNADDGGEQPTEIEVSGPGGIAIRLLEKGRVLPLLDYGSRLYLRIEGIGITEHDKALNLLEDLSNALFMQIDFRFNLALTVGRDSFITRRLARRSNQLDEDNQITFPRFTYDRGPSSLYWYARSATSMPLLQFLAFYQCIEYFFPQYSRQETIARMRNILKDPSFDGQKDSCLNLLLNATVEGRRGSLPEERKQLGATLKQCVDPLALKDFFNETEERKKYYGADYKKISDKRVAITEETTLVDQTAERVYDIRCKIVHTKNLENGDRDEIILPFSKEAELLMDDVELIKFLARKVMVASSIPLSV